MKLSIFSEIFPDTSRKWCFNVIDGTLKQSRAVLLFPLCNGGLDWGEVVVGDEEKEDEKKESRTETWLTVKAFG